MTRILSTRTLNTLRSADLITPARKLAAAPQLAPTDTFEAPKKVSTVRDDGDGFDPGTNKVIDLANSVMGENAADLKVANDTDLGDAMQDWVPNNVNCANFVSGLLTATGQIPKEEGSAGVVNLVNNLRDDPNFTEVSLDDASPGDVVAFEYGSGKKKGHHVVVFEGRDENGNPKFIGSDNVNPDKSQRINRSTGVRSGRRILAVMHYSKDD
ncbi:MAG: peptidoglycan-binding protein LysM [Archangium sp.]|nr:peptidoglycan-binding protein LysM [Archangium sp.]